MIQSDWIDTANNLASSIRSRGFPVTVSMLPDIDLSFYQGNHQKVAEMLVVENILVVRPDHIIAWRACTSSNSILSQPHFIDQDVYNKNGKPPNLKEIYEERVDLMHKNLLSIGLTCNKPDGSFYLFPALPSEIDD